jgi:hypothetical protein
VYSCLQAPDVRLVLRKARVTSPAQLIGQLNELRAPGRADRVAAAQRAPARRLGVAGPDEVRHAS